MFDWLRRMRRGTSATEDRIYLADECGHPETRIASLDLRRSYTHPIPHLTLTPFERSARTAKGNRTRHAARKLREAGEQHA